jgi:hypothetical protein
MTHAARTCMLTFCLAVLSARPAFTQTLASEAIPETSAAAAPVAYVYIGTAKGVNLYDAASNGTLTLVSGSPFKIAGKIVGSNRKYFISLGTNYLHSYPVAANGVSRSKSRRSIQKTMAVAIAGPPAALLSATPARMCTY